MNNTMSDIKEESSVQNVYSRTFSLSLVVLKVVPKKFQAETKMTLGCHGSMSPALGERLTLAISTYSSSAW